MAFLFGQLIISRVWDKIFSIANIKTSDAGRLLGPFVINLHLLFVRQGQAANTWAIATFALGFRTTQMLFVRMSEKLSFITLARLRPLVGSIWVTATEDRLC